MHSNLIINNLIINNLTSNGIEINEIEENRRVYSTHKYEVELLKKFFSEFGKSEVTSEYTCSEIQRYLNFATKSNFSIGVVIFSLFEAGLKYSISNEKDFSFFLSTEEFEKKFLSLRET